MAKRPEKDPNVVPNVASDVANRTVRFSDHALKQMRTRDITRSDAYSVLEFGWREPRKDEWKEEYNSWTYAYRGYDRDEFVICALPSP